MISPSNGRTTCLAGVFVGPGKPLELRSLPLPTLNGGEALVRVECCTICGSDLHTLAGKRNEPTPSILGHELLGTVERVGDPAPKDLAGRPLELGDRITWSIAVSCGTCDRCESGLPQKCRTLMKYGHEKAEGPRALSGGLAEYVLLQRGAAAIRIPAGVSDEVMCPVNCATATVTAAFRAAGPIAGRRVLVFGAGMLGLTACAFAHSQGAGLVAVCDVEPRRLERAKSFGASVGLAWSADAQNIRQQLVDAGQATAFDLVVELSGSADAVEAAIKLCDIGGHVVLVGSVMKSRPIPLDPEDVVRRWLNIHGVHNYAPQDLQSAVDFLARFAGTYPLGELVEFSYPLSEVNTAIERALKERPFRVAIRP